MMYPIMQVADIFAQGVNIAHAGIDQRKAHVIAREVAPYLTVKPLKRKHNEHEEIYKPVALHTMLTMGLQKPPILPTSKAEAQQMAAEMKMSKSKPEGAIFITDSEANIRAKMMGAFCPEKNIEYNPVLQWAKLFVFNINKELTIERQKKYGGTIHFDNYEELEKIYAHGELHPQDLKNGVAESLVETLAPVRKYFENPKHHQLLEELEKVTRGTKL